MENSEDFSEDEDLDDNMAEVEALLYSQIYYENASSDNEKIQLSFNDVYNDIKSDVDSKSGGMKTPGGDSGCGTSRPNSRLSEKLSDNRNLVGGDGNHSPVNDVIDESKYLESYNVVSNPFFDAANSDTESDDGIIILPRREGTPPEIICIDSDSNSSIFKPSPGVVVSDQESINKSLAVKNNKKRIKEHLCKKRKYFVAEYGSDFDENFFSDDSDNNSEVVDDSDKVKLRLNLTNDSDHQDKNDFVQEARKYVDTSSSVPISWTDEMNSYYNDINMRHLNIELEDILAEMPSNSKWPIDRVDVYGTGSVKPRYFQGRRCNNCNQLGHLSRGCPEPIKIPRCPMCGIPGHGENRCPEKSCLRCGQPGFGFLESCMHCRRLNKTECHVCTYVGHVAQDCPDIWRRFHATTNISSFTTPKGGHANKPDSACWCCNCGKKGHLSDSCRSYIYSKYPLTPLRVVSYDKPKMCEFNDSIPTQSKKTRREEKLLRRNGEKRNKNVLNFCPRSPVREDGGVYVSNPTSTNDVNRLNSSSLIVQKAINKLDKDADGHKKKKNINKQVSVNFERKANKRELMSNVLNSSDFGRDIACDSAEKKKSKKIKSLKRVLNARTNFNPIKDDRSKEWKMERGFGKRQEKDFPRNNNKLTRATLIPSDVKAACRLLKKEIQRNDGAASSNRSKKLRKELKQEIFTLRNLHSTPLLKKVERKRLADLIIEVRNCS